MSHIKYRRRGQAMVWQIIIIVLIIIAIICDEDIRHIAAAIGILYIICGIVVLIVKLTG